MSALWSDIRVVVRGLLKTPGFAAAAIGALALGIGPNAAIFSIVHATFLEPIPYPQPDQIVLIWSRVGTNRELVSPAEYLDWKARASSFQYLEPIMARRINLATPESPERIRARQTSPDGHRMWGEEVSLGRDFAPGEDQPGKNHVVLLSHRLWRERFAADPGIVGREIRMDGTPYTVIGILRPGVNDRIPAALWIPLSLTPREIANRQFRPLLMAGRLKPGVTIAQAQQEMDALAEEAARQFPDSNKGRRVSVEGLQNNFLRGDAARNLWLLLAAVSFVVLIACVNVANLLLSRGAARERETAIRAALGASRARLAWRALTESLVLALAGGILGALSSVWILQGILAIMPAGTLPAEANPRLNVPVLAFALLAVTLAGLLSGAAHAWQAYRGDWNDALKQSGRTTGGGRRAFRQALVVIETALAATLLAGAGLTIVSFWQRTQVDLGVRTDHVLTFGLPVNEGRFTSSAEIEAFYARVLEQLQSLPGVLHAAITAPGVPLTSAGFSKQFSIVGQTDDSPSLRPRAGVQMVTPGYFETFGIRLVRGRPFTLHDRAGAPRVALVNERFVQSFLRGQDPLHRRLVMDEFVAGTQGLGGASPVPGADAEWLIVGVFRDVRNVQRFEDPEAPQIYIPFAQTPWPQVTAAVRTAADPEALRPGLAAVVRSVDPDLPLADVRTMDQIVRERLASDRLNIALYGSLAALALVLSALGIYGVIAYNVAQRTSEIGLRMALGAERLQVRLHIIRDGVRLAAGGLVLGSFGAYFLGRAMQSTLYGTGAFSIPVLLAVGAVLLIAAVLASYVPARRASAVDPLMALRQE